MRIAFLIVTLAMSLSLYKCANGGGAPASDSFAVGAYEYSGYDEAGKKVISGRLNLTEIKGQDIKGTWELKQVGAAEKIGPQVGTGNFVGQVESNRVNINLNPDWNDNNIFLSGNFEKGELRGDWHFSTFAGAASKGTFVAKKK
jgi:hypothetical protein